MPVMSMKKVKRILINVIFDYYCDTSLIFLITILQTTRLTLGIARIIPTLVILPFLATTLGLRWPQL
jgi:hypothetical protein